MTENRQLLAEYAEHGSEAAFREVVHRYVDLVYSAAIRLVNSDAHLAQDVTQTVFADLARCARSLTSDVMLGGWLHRHTCFVARKTLRTERRRLARERQAVDMNSLEDHSAANLALITPVLDDAINQLGDEDRKAILLRYFEQQDFQSVGAALGGTEEAARKRVDRALQKLEALLKRRGVALSAAGLATALAAQAVTAAPTGLALTISGAALTTAAASGATTLTFIKIMSMTKLQLSLVTIVVTAGLTVPWVLQQRTQSRLKETRAALQQNVAKVESLVAENARLNELLAKANTKSATAEVPPRELLKLRAENSKLRQQSETDRLATAARTNTASALSGITSDPAMRKAIRDQQKAGLGMIYRDFGKRANLPKETGEKLAALLADDVMDNIDRITEVLREGKSPSQMEEVFAAQEAALQVKVKELLGEEGYQQYHDYTKNLASYLTAEQFKSMMTGEKDEKDSKAKQLYELMQVEVAQALRYNHLSEDYQIVPSLNFRNFASENEAEKNLQLLGGIYEQVTARAGDILSPQEIAKFTEFRTNALNANRMALALNRKLMSPANR